MPQALSLWGVLLPEQSQSDTACAVHPAVPSIVVTLHVISPPCLEWPHCPAKGLQCVPMLVNTGQVSESVS